MSSAQLYDTVESASGRVRTVLSAMMKGMLRRRRKPDQEGDGGRRSDGVRWVDSSEKRWTVPVRGVRPVTGRFELTSGPRATNPKEDRAFA
jgi:hypothetical protein